MIHKKNFWNSSFIVRSFSVLAISLFLSFNLFATEEKPLTNKTVSRLIKQAMPSVIAIKGKVTPDKSSQKTAPQGNIFGFPFDQMFRQPQRQGSSLGSGAVISKDGYVVTNFHVIKGVEEKNLHVEFHDGRIFDAGEVKIVGVDDNTDIAVLKLPEGEYDYLPFADSDQLEVGEFIFALGNPFGQLYSASMGIVSATGRQLRGIEGAKIEFQDYIQTDAAINPGNSGGPLMNLDGDIIGINNVISTTSGGSIGLGYAISSNVAKDVTKQLIENGQVKRGWIGVSLSDFTQNRDLKEFYDIEDGVFINKVLSDSPAEKAGMKKDEVIFKIDDQDIRTTKDLVDYITHSDIGEKVTIHTLNRKQGKAEYEVDVAERPSSEELASSTVGKMSKDLLGMQFQDLNNDLRRLMHINDDVNGVLVTQVYPDSKAFEKGVRKGDVLIELNGRDIRSMIQLEKTLAQEKKSRKFLLVLSRNGMNMYVAIKNN